MIPKAGCGVFGVRGYGRGGVYDKRFLRPSGQGLRARLNGVGLSL